mmetsp:Transcript_4371/g.11022  ORF Transcript_4371/g.11022 Transcript_4371/m.11022 type:complete len:88 (+) Transcript_4371:156-419(+)
MKHFRQACLCAIETGRQVKSHHGEEKQARKEENRQESYDRGKGEGIQGQDKRFQERPGDSCRSNIFRKGHGEILWTSRGLSLSGSKM